MFAEHVKKLEGGIVLNFGTAVMGPLVDAGNEHIMLAISGVGLAGVGIITAGIRRRRIA